jgi:hypothetical protein
MSSFLSFFWSFHGYQSSRPRDPQPDAGQVYPLRNGQTVGYLTNVESTGVAFLAGVSLAGFLLAIVIVPKGKYLPGTKLPTALDYPTQRQYLLIFAAGVFYLAIVVLWGRHIIAFAVSHGIVFSLG